MCCCQPCRLQASCSAGHVLPSADACGGTPAAAALLRLRLGPRASAQAAATAAVAASTATAAASMAAGAGPAAGLLARALLRALLLLALCHLAAGAVWRLPLLRLGLLPPLLDLFAAACFLQTSRTQTLLSNDAVSGQRAHSVVRPIDSFPIEPVLPTCSTPAAPCGTSATSHGWGPAPALAGCGSSVCPPVAAGRAEAARSRTPAAAGRD